MPKPTVYAAAVAMLIAALIGLYLGVGRSLASPSGLADEAGAVVPPVTAVASAKPILTPTPTLDEAQVRRFAREEAEAVLAKSASRKAPSADDSKDDSTTEELTPVAPPTALAPTKPTSQAPQG